MKAPSCPACAGEVFFLGQLGMREHFRCRACGMDCSRVKKARKPRTPKKPEVTP